MPEDYLTNLSKVLEWVMQQRVNANQRLMEQRYMSGLERVRQRAAMQRDLYQRALDIAMPTPTTPKPLSTSEQLLQRLQGKVEAGIAKPEDYALAGRTFPKPEKPELPISLNSILSGIRTLKAGEEVEDAQLLALFPEIKEQKAGWREKALEDLRILGRTFYPQQAFMFEEYTEPALPETLRVETPETTESYRPWWMRVMQSPLFPMPEKQTALPNVEAERPEGSWRVYSEEEIGDIEDLAKEIFGEEKF